MLNSPTVLSRKKLLLGLGIIGIVAIANALFSLEHDWHLLSITTMMVGGTLLFVNVRQSFAAVLDKPIVIDRAYLFKQLDQAQIAIAKISDLLKRQSLNAQAQQISHDLQKNHFRIVIFGTGSAGKTSVINALLGRNVGKTGAAIGTTITRQEYTYQDLEAAAVIHQNANKNSETKLKRQISLLDTSGIQEMGAVGQQRELDALKISRNSDLIIFVTAGDLTNSEYRELDSLANLGKRVILAFNKTDLYLPCDREQVLAKLKERTQQFTTTLAPIDIVAICAHPTPIKVRQYANADSADSATLQEWWEDVPPDVSSLKERIESILSHEWEDLLIRNTQLQIENLWQEINGTINLERRQDAATLINRYQLVAATTVFANPIPALDLLAGAAINTQMLLDLAKIYDRPLSFKQAQQLAVTLAQQLLQLGCVEIATSAIASCFKVNAITYALGGSVQAITAAYLTHIGGLSFIEYLEQQPQTAISDNPIAINSLQQICQRTFKSLQGEQFFFNFIHSVSQRLVST
ncbi:YcjF family protein [Pseudanabaena mucicola]|uniref:DUF697 domain-containing protein n=1 Tax=Pseudanabaena mucicola FACHB-723 TaxID=2692860 RepID=A0ABR7ZY44_9CYAN|nr:DUF697 domain-containing protein [Pseudanabaena mucicola]MBD2188782.1 DUF697 domain-containing protein [Pseudanabaena mucicola FACHB-723]